MTDPLDIISHKCTSLYNKHFMAISRFLDCLHSYTISIQLQCITTQTATGSFSFVTMATIYSTLPNSLISSHLRLSVQSFSWASSVTTASENLSLLHSLQWEKEKSFFFHFQVLSLNNLKNYEVTVCCCIAWSKQK